MKNLTTLAAAAVIAIVTPLLALADGKATNAEIVEQYIEIVVNGRAFDRINEYVAADLIQHNPNLPNGREPLKDFWTGFLADLPDAHFKTVRMISEGDLVVDHSIFTPTIGARGVAIVDIYRLEDGLIVQHWDVSTPIPQETASGNHPVYDR